MSVTPAELKLYQAANMPNNDEDENGGAINGETEIEGVLDEVFIDAYSKELEEGDRIVYRKVFFKNTAATALTDARIWMSADEHDYITLDLESAKGGTDTSTNRITAPTDGYTFAEHNSEALAHAVPTGTLGAGEVIGIWLKLTIAENQDPDAEITATLKCKGRTV